MKKLMASQLYTILHSRGALLLLAAALLFSFFCFYSSMTDFRDVQDLRKTIWRWDEKGLDGLAIIQNNHDLQGMEDLEEIIAILRRRQVVGAPNGTIDGMFAVILFLPGSPCPRD